MPRRKIAVLDCETDPFKRQRIPRPFIWGYYDGKEYIQVPTWQQVLPYTKAAPAVCKQCRETRPLVRKICLACSVSAGAAAVLSEEDAIVYAHNGGRFDWHFLLPYLAEYDDLMIINGRIARMNIGIAECRDSYNIIPVPLAAYKKAEFDYRLMEESQRFKPKNWELITEYLRSDCVNLYELVTGFVDQYGVLLTLASAAINQCKKISTRPLPKSDKEFYDEIFPYYYGGRVECFEHGIIDTEFSVYDINSAYPFAMLEPHPYSTEFIQSDGYSAGADFYRIRGVSRGAFPWRGAREGDRYGGLHFPHDNEIREYTVTHWEYEAAKDTRTIGAHEVLESITFTDHVDFCEYITHFYEMRLKAKAEKDDAKSLFAKLLMNSLYGKFASNPENYRNYMVVPMDKLAGIDEAGWSFAGELGPWALAEAPLTEDQQRYYNIATSASITGFVRAMLWRSICSSKGVLYCDTDSIAVRHAGKAMGLGDALGMWKHEGTFDRAGIAGKKLYIFRGTLDAEGKRTYKKASKGAKLTHAQLWRVAAGGEVDYVPEVPTFSPQKAPVFTARRIRFTARSLRMASIKTVSRLRAARAAHFGQEPLDFNPPQQTLDLW